MGHICRQLEFDETYTGIGEDTKKKKRGGFMKMFRKKTAAEVEKDEKEKAAKAGRLTGGRGLAAALAKRAVNAQNKMKQEKMKEHQKKKEEKKKSKKASKEDVTET